MRIVVIEDEPLTAQNLVQLLREQLPGAVIPAVLESVSESVEWLEQHPMPDLVFMDIHLADGSSFSIFDKVSVTCPIIFTTAYDEYALRAFEVNSIDYLLKPVGKEALVRALDKWERLTASAPVAAVNRDLIMQVAAAIRQQSDSFKSSLLIARGDKLIPLAVKEIAYIQVEGRQSVAVTLGEHSYPLPHSLDEVMKQLDPGLFFRANRQTIVARPAVREITQWFGNRIAVNLLVNTPERIIVSRNHAQEFKNWLTE